MTTDQINQLFKEKIKIKGIQKVLQIDKTAISNYRRRCDELSLGLKLELLLKMDEIVIYPKLEKQFIEKMNKEYEKAQELAKKYF